MKIGDKVKFLSEVGGGKIAGFKGKNIVLVEDEDGFQIPTPVNDVVLVGGEDYSTGKAVANKLGGTKQEMNHDGQSIKAMLKKGQEEPVDTATDIDPASLEITFRHPTEERKGGNKLSAYLAFVPIDIKEMTNTRFECYFVNDSNYYLHYAYLVAEGANWQLKDKGEVEPNTKLFIEEFGRDVLNGMERVAIQLQAYKKDKAFVYKPTVDVQFRIDPVKFYKLHTFAENDFFEQPALLYPVIEDDVPARSLNIDAETLKSKMYQSASQKDAKRTAEGVLLQDKRAQNASDYVRRYESGRYKDNPLLRKRRGDEQTFVVDLHADTLLDTTAGMSTADILNYQMQKFHEILDSYKGRKGQKIIFIHGKGEGVLRHAIVKELTYRYKNYQYQDASFQEYGYGATQVTIK